MATDNELEGCVALPIGWLIMWPVGALRALVAMKGWEWFVADTFSLPELTFIQAWGLFVLIGFATMHLDTSKNDRRPFESMFYAMLLSLFASGMYFISLLILSAFV